MKRHLERWLGALAARAVRRERPRIIAVAGSVGKSSTKHAIGIALGADRSGSDVRVSPKNYNNELGVPLTIFNLSAPGRSPFGWIKLVFKALWVGLGFGKIGARTLVLEFGTDHPGDLNYLMSIAPPDVAVLTAIGAEHTEYFGSVQAVAEEELSVIRVISSDGIAILNGDDERVMVGRSLTPGHVVTFGESPEAMVRIRNVTIESFGPEVWDSGLRVDFTAPGLNASLDMKGLFGTAQTRAVAAALAVVHALDYDFQEAIDRIAISFTGMPGRTRVLPGIKHTALLDDTYNSSPLAALAAVQDLAAFPVLDGSRRIAALGDMLELGPLAHEAHADLGRAVAEAKIDMLIACGKLADVVIEAARKSGMSADVTFVFETSVEAGAFIQQRLQKGDVVLIKGSQGIRMEKITKELMAHPEDAKELLVRQTPEWET